MLINKRGKNLNFSGTSKKHYSPKKKIYLNVKQLKKNQLLLTLEWIKKANSKI